MQISTILALLLRPAPAHFLCDSEFIAATRLPVGGQIWGRNTPLKSACDPSPDPFCCWGRTGPWPAPWPPWCGIAICLATGVEADIGLVLGQAPLGVEADVGLVPGQGPPWCRGRCLFPSYDPLGNFALASWQAWKSGYGGGFCRIWMCGTEKFIHSCILNKVYKWLRTYRQMILLHQTSIIGLEIQFLVTYQGVVTVFLMLYFFCGSKILILQSLAWTKLCEVQREMFLFTLFCRITVVFQSRLDHFFFSLSKKLS